MVTEPRAPEAGSSGRIALVGGRCVSGAGPASRYVSALSNAGWSVTRIGSQPTSVGSEGLPSWIDSTRLSWPLLGSWLIRRLPWHDPDERPDLLHALDVDSMELVISLAEHWSLPYVLSIAPSTSEDQPLRISRRWCEAIVVPCPSIAEGLIREYRIPRSLVRVLPRGVRCLTQPRTVFVPNRVPVVGTCEPEESADPNHSGIGLFVAAAAALTKAGVDLEWLVACHLDVAPTIRQIANQFGVGENLTVIDAADEQLGWLDVLDLYVRVPRDPTYDPVLVEAAARGLPSLVSNVPSISEFGNDARGGRCLGALEPDHLAQAIRDFVDDPESAADAGQRAWSWANAHALLDTEVDALLALYEHILEPVSENA